MTDEEIRIHNERMISEALAANKPVLEFDGALIIGYGSDADYDTHFVDVQNGNGYYDENGDYVRYASER